MAEQWIPHAADTIYWVTATTRSTRNHAHAFSDEKSAHDLLRKYRIAGVVLEWDTLIGNVAWPYPRLSRIVSAEARQIDRTWLDPGVAHGCTPDRSLKPAGLGEAATMRTWGADAEYQVFITSNEKPGTPEMVGHYAAEADARARIASIDSAGSKCRVQSWSPPPSGPERTGVVCHLARVESRQL